jgi:hypothetical protein
MRVDMAGGDGSLLSGVCGSHVIRGRNTGEQVRPTSSVQHGSADYILVTLEK